MRQLRISWARVCVASESERRARRAREEALDREPRRPQRPTGPRAALEPRPAGRRARTQPMTSRPHTDFVHTALGPVAPEALGVTLPHEHILSTLTVHLEEPRSEAKRGAAPRRAAHGGQPAGGPGGAVPTPRERAFGRRGPRGARAHPVPRRRCIHGRGPDPAGQRPRPGRTRAPCAAYGPAHRRGLRPLPGEDAFFRGRGVRGRGAGRAAGGGAHRRRGDGRHPVRCPRRDGPHQPQDGGRTQGPARRPTRR